MRHWLLIRVAGMESGCERTFSNLVRAPMDCLGDGDCGGGNHENKNIETHQRIRIQTSDPP